MMQRIVLLFITLAALFPLQEVKASANDHGAAVAGTYEGETNIELLKVVSTLQLELKRTHKDSVIVVIKDFALPTGQRFNFKSQNVSVKKETENGKTVYKLHTTFNYTYNNMPLQITATGTIRDGELDSVVKANLMGAMETKVTYKAKKKP